MLSLLYSNTNIDIISVKPLINILQLYFIIDKYLTFDTIKNGNPTNITYEQKTDKKYH